MWDCFFSPLPYVRTYVFRRCRLILVIIQKVLSSHKKPLQILVKLFPPQFLAKLNDRSSNTWGVVPVWKLKMSFSIVFSKLQKTAKAASTTEMVCLATWQRGVICWTQVRQGRRALLYMFWSMRRPPPPTCNEWRSSRPSIPLKWLIKIFTMSLYHLSNNIHI